MNWKMWPLHKLDMGRLEDSFRSRMIDVHSAMMRSALPKLIPWQPGDEIRFNSRCCK